MFKYTMYNYDDKQSVKRFYNFYQNILLDNFLFEHLGPYQTFVENLVKNELYNAIIVYDENELGGVIFEYDEVGNKGIIHYVATKKKDTNLKEMIIDLATYYIKEDAKLFNNEEPEIIENVPQSKNQNMRPDIVHSDEYFLKQLLIPTIKKRKL